jgi:hypothetical protein
MLERTIGKKEVRGHQCHPGVLERAKERDGFHSSLRHTVAIEGIDRRDAVSNTRGRLGTATETDRVNELRTYLCSAEIFEKTDGRNEVRSGMACSKEVVMRGGRIEVRILPFHTEMIERVDRRNETRVSHGEMTDQQDRVLIRLQWLKGGARLGSSLSKNQERRGAGRIGWFYESMECGCRYQSYSSAGVY